MKQQLTLIFIFGLFLFVKSEAQIGNPYPFADKYPGFHIPHKFEYTGSSMYDYALHQKEIDMVFEKGWRRVELQKKESVFQQMMDDNALEFNTFGSDENRETKPKNKEEEVYDEAYVERLAKATEEEYLYFGKKIATSFGSISEIGKISWKQVQSKLSKNTAAIEFIETKYNKGKWGEKYFYYAMVIRPEYGSPKIVPLGEAEIINNILAKQKRRNAAILYFREGKGGTKTYGKKLYELVWSGVDDLLDGIEDVFFSPSGKLHRLAFNALQDENKQFLSEKYKLHQLGTTRDLVVGVTDSYLVTKGCWVIVGDVSFHEYPQMLSNSRNQPCTSVMENRAYNGVLPPEYRLPRLAYTKTEMDAISKMLTVRGVSFQSLSGTGAPEEYFKSLGEKNPSPSVLHIGTHGGYSSPKKPRSEKQEINSSALMNSYLYLSGAAHSLHFKKPFPKREDGMWTGGEIVEQDLKNTQLVVLSACNSGLGGIAVREGVYGLQRAFKVAGVKKILASLWETRDDATAFFMKKFYNHWFSGKTAYESYRQTQIEMQQHPDFNSPYFWGAFVLLE